MQFILSSLHRGKRTASLDEIRDDLKKLNEFFSEATFPLFLVGGIGMAVQRGRFFRYHRDLDIAIFRDDFEALYAYLSSREYSIIEKYFSAHVSPWLNLQGGKQYIGKPTKEEADRLSFRVKSKTTLPFTYARRRMNYLDLFLLEKSNDGVYLLGYNRLVKWEDFEPYRPMLPGSKVLLPNINYKKQLQPVNEQERLDFEESKLKPAYLTTKK